MALVVFLRGINVGGRRTFRPSLLARALRSYDVVNIGAAGTFVVRRPGPRAMFCAALLPRLPFAVEVIVCDARDVLELVRRRPFARTPARAGTVRFVSVFARPMGKALPPMPCALPSSGRWYVRVIGAYKQFLLGEYRREMKTIGYLGRLDALFRGRAATRNWNTICTITRVLQAAADD